MSVTEQQPNLSEEASRFSAEEVGRLNVSRRQSDRELIEGGARGRVDKRGKRGLSERLVPTKEQVERIKYTDNPDMQSASQVAAQAEISLGQAAPQEKFAPTEITPTEVKIEISAQDVEQAEVNWKLAYDELDGLMTRFRDEIPDSEVLLFTSTEEYIEGTRAGYTGTVITAKQYLDSLSQATAVLFGIKRRMIERHRH